MTAPPLWLYGEEGEHEHKWGVVEIAPMTGNPHRRCEVLGCRFITLDLDDPKEVTA